MRKWAEKHDLELKFIQPGNPQQMLMWDDLIEPYATIGSRITGMIPLPQYKTAQRPGNGHTTMDTLTNMALGDMTPKQKLALNT